MAGAVNHGMNNETVEITDTIYLAHDTVMERKERLRREQYRARRNRETAEERESRLEARARERHQNAMKSTKQRQILLQRKRQARNHSVANTCLMRDLPILIRNRFSRESTSWMLRLAP